MQIKGALHSSIPHSFMHPPSLTMAQITTSAAAAAVAALVLIVMVPLSAGNDENPAPMPNGGVDATYGLGPDPAAGCNRLNCANSTGSWPPLEVFKCMYHPTQKYRLSRL